LVRLRPRSPQYALLLARTAYAAGKEGQAREVLRKSADLFAANPELLSDVEALLRMLAKPDHP
jgi:hypothetical protein